MRMHPSKRDKALNSDIESGINSTRNDDFLDQERAAQREEFLKREGNNLQKQYKVTVSNSKKQPGVKKINKAPSFEEQLELTYQWLEDTFPHLFAADDYIPLDDMILCDLKNHYKNNVAKKKYPANLVIKAAISRHKQNPGYLAFIKEGAEKYSIDGKVTGRVTKEEEENAMKILETT